MKTLISCAYTMDNCCVELKFRDGRMIAIDTIAVENEIADNMYQRSELDYLIYNDPIAYADLILNGDWNFLFFKISLAFLSQNMKLHFPSMSMMMSYSLHSFV